MTCGLKKWGWLYATLHSERELLKVGLRYWRNTTWAICGSTAWGNGVRAAKFYSLISSWGFFLLNVAGSCWQIMAESPLSSPRAIYVRRVMDTSDNGFLIIFK